MLLDAFRATVPLPPALRDVRRAPAPDPMFGCIELAGGRMSFEPNTEIFGQDDPAEYVYQVLSGTLRTYRLLSDGRRQVSAFHFPGDVFGLESGAEHVSSAEAVTRTSVLVVRRSALLAAAAHNAEVARQLWQATARELQRSQEHGLLLIKSAPERVAAFLLGLAERLRTDGTVELPMSRRDIADYLGLTMETVSRTLTQFESNGIIELPVSRRVVLRNRSALRRLNG